MPSHHTPPPGVGRRFPARRAVSVAALAALALGAGRPVTGQERAVVIPSVPVDTFRLANGLRVMVSEDHSAPVVAVNVWFRAGSAYEETGRAGFARLVERLLFQRTEELEAGAVDRLVTGAGGLYSAATGPDRTALSQVLPANRLNLALWLLGEQMSRVRITGEAVAAQRGLMTEERRLRVETQPYAAARLAADTLAQDYPPYRHSPVGPAASLEGVETAEVEGFYRRYYAPANALLAVVGDATPDEVRSMARQFLGDIDGGPPAPDLPELPPVPRTDGERRAVVDDPLARLPLVWIAYTIPPAAHPDRHALELLETVLGGGSGGRLRKRLVDGVGVAVDVSSELDLRAGPGALRIGAVAGRGVGVERVEALLEEEVARLRGEGVSDRELQAAVNGRRSALVGSLLTVQGKASALQWHAFYQGSPSSLDDEMARYRAVTPEDVRRVARTYLTPENRTVVVARPSPGPAGGGK
ncbi:MAG TPA: pitrilysin family protein [Longimicrobiales bacterium]|nr:pitrilysin family protein [Longimicrobiales bacterium]